MAATLVRRIEALHGAISTCAGDHLEIVRVYRSALPQILDLHLTPESSSVDIESILKLLQYIIGDCELAILPEGADAPVASLTGTMLFEKVLPIFGNPAIPAAHALAANLMSRIMEARCHLALRRVTPFQVLCVRRVTEFQFIFGELTAVLDTLAFLTSDPSYMSETGPASIACFRCGALVRETVMMNAAGRVSVSGSSQRDKPSQFSLQFFRWYRCDMPLSMGAAQRTQDIVADLPFIVGSLAQPLWDTCCNAIPDAGALAAVSWLELLVHLMESHDEVPRALAPAVGLCVRHVIDLCCQPGAPVVLQDTLYRAAQALLQGCDGVVSVSVTWISCFPTWIAAALYGATPERLRTMLLVLMTSVAHHATTSLHCNHLIVGQLQFEMEGIQAALKTALNRDDLVLPEALTSLLRALLYFDGEVRAGALGAPSTDVSGLVAQFGDASVATNGAKRMKVGLATVVAASTSFQTDVFAPVARVSGGCETFGAALAATLATAESQVSFSLENGEPGVVQTNLDVIRIVFSALAPFISGPEAVGLSPSFLPHIVTSCIEFLFKDPAVWNDAKRSMQRALLELAISLLHQYAQAAISKPSWMLTVAYLSWMDSRHVQRFLLQSEPFASGDARQALTPDSAVRAGLSELAADSLHLLAILSSVSRDELVLQVVLKAVQQPRTMGPALDVLPIVLASRAHSFGASVQEMLDRVLPVLQALTQADHRIALAYSRLVCVVSHPGKLAAFFDSADQQLRPHACQRSNCLFVDAMQTCDAHAGLSDLSEQQGTVTVDASVDHSLDPSDGFADPPTVRADTVLRRRGLPDLVLVCPSCPSIRSTLRPIAAAGARTDKPDIQPDIVEQFVAYVVRTMPLPGLVQDRVGLLEQFPRLCVHCPGLITAASCAPILGLVNESQQLRAAVFGVLPKLALLLPRSTHLDLIDWLRAQFKALFEQQEANVGNAPAQRVSVSAVCNYINCIVLLATAQTDSDSAMALFEVFADSAAPALMSACFDALVQLLDRLQIPSFRLLVRSVEVQVVFRIVDRLAKPNSSDFAASLDELLEIGSAHATKRRARPLEQLILANLHVLLPRICQARQVSMLLVLRELTGMSLLKLLLTEHGKAAVLVHVLVGIFAHPEPEAAHEWLKAQLQDQEALQYATALAATSTFAIVEVFLRHIWSPSENELDAIVGTSRGVVVIDQSAKQALVSCLSRLFGKGLDMRNIDAYICDQFHGILHSIGLQAKFAAENGNTADLRDIARAFIALLSGFRTQSAVAVLHVKTLSCLTTLSAGDARLAAIGFEKFVAVLNDAGIKSYFSHIIVTLLPLLTDAPDCAPIIFRIYTELLVTRSSLVRSRLEEVRFLLDFPNLQLPVEIRAALERDRKPDPHTQLKNILPAIEHPSADVKHRALEILLKWLREHRALLNLLIQGRDTVDGAVASLIRKLHGLFARADENIQQLAAVCLAEIGAVDPSRLPAANMESGLPRGADTDVEVSPSELFEGYLVPLLLTSKSERQDLVAYAMQQCCRFYGLTRELEAQTVAGARPSKAEAIWFSLEDDTRSIIGPYLISSYNARQTLRRDRADNLPVFPRCSSASEWLKEWTQTLTEMIPVESAQSSEIPTVFHACIAVSQWDVGICEYLLPFLTAHILRLEHPPASHRISNEFKAIFSRLATTSPSSVPAPALQKTQSTLRNSLSKASLRADMHWDDLVRSAEVAFAILDGLKRFGLAKEKRPQSSRGEQPGSPFVKGAAAIREFLRAELDTDLLGQAAMNAGMSQRALRCWEEIVHEQDPAKPYFSKQSKMLRDFQNIYRQLDESDGLVGVAAYRSDTFDQPTISATIVDDKSANNWAEALACYEMMLQNLDQSSVTTQENPHVGMLDCFMELGHYETTFTHASGLLDRLPELGGTLRSYMARSAWRIGRWDDLRRITADEHFGADGFHDHVSKLLSLTQQECGAEDFQTQLDQSLALVLRRGGLLSQGPGEKGYDSLLYLHAVRDIELLLPACSRTPQTAPGARYESSNEVGPLIAAWDQRFQVTRDTVHVREPLLSLRRSLLRLLSLREPSFHDQCAREIGKTWIASARLSRESKNFQTAFSAILQAKHTAILDADLSIQASVETARLHWDQGQLSEAVSLLKRGLESFESSRTSTLSFASANLLLGSWMVETARYDADVVIAKFRGVIDTASALPFAEGSDSEPEVHRILEEAYFALARYCDQVFELDGERRGAGVAVVDAVQAYGQTLHHGSKYIFRALPRLLTLWFEQSNKSLDAAAKTPAKPVVITSLTSRYSEQALHDEMRRLADGIAPFQLLVSLPQLISRICHASPMVTELLDVILVRLLESYPDQTLWMMMSVLKSSYKPRQQRCQEILRKAEDKMPRLKVLKQTYTTLTTSLIGLCNRPVSSDTTSFMIADCGGLGPSSQYRDVLIPMTSTLVSTLPNGAAPTDFSAFPNALPYISSFQEKATILSSLQRPRKIGIIGSDGKIYHFLCKPKDDMRKDARLMEFNAIVNKLLVKDPESRRRQLRIRTYAVIPLNEECGLIEWIPNTVGFRNIVNDVYKAKGKYVHSSEIRTTINPKSYPTKLTAREIFEQHLLPKFPPVFSEWFLNSFPDPAAWYASRRLYTTSCAVMSMVGYVVGLGDRHGENILYDETTGESLHVDFNCLFNKGETFETPERVPFRLTRNMVEAFGATRQEGVYRRSCEVTLNVLRSERDALTSVLTPFIHDPLLEWSSAKNKMRPAGSSAELVNETAVATIRNLENRLKGIDKKQKGPPLSVEGQVEKLINEATSLDNLSAMYIGWAAYL